MTLRGAKGDIVLVAGNARARRESRQMFRRFLLRDGFVALAAGMHPPLAPPSKGGESELNKSHARFTLGQAMMPCTTSPWTSVRRMSRPPKR